MGRLCHLDDRTNLRGERSAGDSQCEHSPRLPSDAPRTARMNPAAISERETGLRRGLSKAQIGMIGLGGAIGTGLFMGSSLAIGYAGPAVIVS